MADSETRPATLQELLRRAHPGQVALSCGDVQWSYGQLADEAGRLAAGLRARGLGPGDVLGLWLPSTSRWLLLHLACAMLGVATLSLNPRLGLQELADFLARARCKALACDGCMAAGAASALERLRAHAGGPLQLLIHAGGPQDQAAWDALPAQPGLAGEAVAADRPCIVLSSSGTTSRPKLIVHAQRHVALHAQDAARSLALDAGSRVLLALPLCGAFGYTVALAALAGGATLELHEGFEPVQAAQALHSRPVTHMFGTNDMLDRMIAPLPPHWRPRALRVFGHASFVPGLDDLPERAQRLGIHMVGCFGMSEVLALFAHQPVDAPLQRRAQAGGIPVSPGAEVRVRSLDGARLNPPLETGELELRGPHMMQGYLDDASATALAFTGDGFLRTGDLGYVQGDGGFTFVSRLGDVLRIGGFLVHPAEIEETVLAISGASACQAVAVVTDAGSRPVAFVIAGPGQTVDEDHIRQECQRRIARYKVPVRIFSVDHFPTITGPNGAKVQRNALRDLAQRLLSQEV